MAGGWAKEGVDGFGEWEIVFLLQYAGSAMASSLGDSVSQKVGGWDTES